MGLATHRPSRLLIVRNSNLNCPSSVPICHQKSTFVQKPPPTSLKTLTLTGRLMVAWPKPQFSSDRNTQPSTGSRIRTPICFGSFTVIRSPKLVSTLTTSSSNQVDGSIGVTLEMARAPCLLTSKFYSCTGENRSKSHESLHTQISYHSNVRQTIFSYDVVTNYTGCPTVNGIYLTCLWRFSLG